MNSEKYTDETILTFGKYEGFKLTNVPADYLLYLYDNKKSFGKLHEYIIENIDILRLEKKTKNN